MKGIIYVFSGTGNTLKVAKKYQEQFNANNIETEIFSVTTDLSNVPNPNNYDYVGFGYPIHAFNAPELYVNFAKSLPNIEKEKISYIFKSSGESLKVNDCSSQKLLSVLRKKGFAPSTERHYIMPYNMIFRHRDQMAKHMWIYAQALVKANTKEILAGKKEKLRLPLIKRLHAPMFRVEWKFSKSNGKRFKVDYDKCSLCQKCVNVCPTKNISFEDGKIVFGKDCALCVACSFGCPKNAISIGILEKWKVNGDYKVNKLQNDENLKFPFITEDTKGPYRLYLKYYRNADKNLKENGVDLEY